MTDDELETTLPLEDGRYEYDLGTRLVWTPGEKRPLVVYVWRWTTHDGGGWIRANSILDRFETRSFRGLERALKYRAKVQADADHGHVLRVMRERTFEKRAEGLA